MNEPTSTTLLKGLLDPRNGQAWGRFEARYVPMLLSYAKRMGLQDADARDVVAETVKTFLEAYSAGRYDRERARLKSWLGGIAQKKVLKHFGRRAPASLDSAKDDNGRTIEPQSTDDVDEAFEREWQLERLNEALEILRRDCDPTKYQAFDLYALKEWPVPKVASFLDVTPNVVYINKTRILKNLRQIVDQLVKDEEQG